MMKSPHPRAAANLAHRPSYESAEFFTTFANQEAFRAAQRWPEGAGEGVGEEHALLLRGDGGSGKTHLAEIWSAQRHPRRLEARALGRAEWAALAPREGECFLLEDAHTLADGDGEGDGGDAAAAAHGREAGFQHFLDDLSRARGHLLMTARTVPSTWGLSLADLRSRLAGVRCIELYQPDDALLEALLAKQFNDRHLRAPSEVLSWMVRCIERSYPAAREAVEQLDTLTLAAGSELTTSLARRVLGGEREEEG